MRKVIKEFNNNYLTYQLGYNLYNNKVYPRIEIYKNNKIFSSGFLVYGANASLFHFGANNSSSNAYGYVGTIKEMFNKLRKYNDIPQNIEREYENIFILYKLNDFIIVREKENIDG